MQHSMKYKTREGRSERSVNCYTFYVCFVCVWMRRDMMNMLPYATNCSICNKHMFHMNTEAPRSPGFSTFFLQYDHTLKHQWWVGLETQVGLRKQFLTFGFFTPFSSVDSLQVEAIVNFLLIGCFKDLGRGDKLQCSVLFRVIRILQWKEHSSTACSCSKFKDMVTESNTSLFVSHYVNQMWTICFRERRWLDIGPNVTKSSAQPYPKCDKIILDVTNRRIYDYVMNEGAFTFFYLLLWKKMLGHSPSTLWE